MLYPKRLKPKFPLRGSLCFGTLLGLLLATNARAADTVGGDAIAACRALSGDPQRLACYDRLFPASAPPPEDNPLLPNPPAVAPHPVSLMIDDRWELLPGGKKGQFRLLPYKPVYVLAAFHASSTNTLPSSLNEDNTAATPLNLDDTESKFQLSLKSKLWENVIGDFSDLWFGYTQSSRWQVFNSGNSRPFRETDYEPELMMAFRAPYSLLGWQGRLLTAGVNHQSNGRSNPLSRGWTRFIVSTALEHGPWAVSFRPWMRVDESPRDDDNPDIEDFMGRGDITLTYSGPHHELSAIVRHSLRDGDRSHGSLELNWAFPIRGNLKGYLQLFSGYGESLIDYNRSATYMGLGVSFIPWYAPAREAAN